MENVSGEELNWFWRGWFFNKWKIDQAVKSAKYIDGDFKRVYRSQLKILDNCQCLLRFS
jgi:hypothetical protein